MVPDFPRRRSVVLAGLLLAAVLVNAAGSGASRAHAAPAFTSFLVYYPLYVQSGSYVFPVKYFVPPTVTPAKAAIEALIAGLPDKGGVSFVSLPKDTVVRSVSISAGGECTVDFSEEIRKVNVGSGGEAAIISAIVSTLSQFPNVNSVRILVGGKPVESLAGHVDVSGSVPRNVGPVFQVLDDATQHWGGGAVAALQTSDIVNGYEDGTFKPDRTVSRAEFVKMLVEGLRLPYVSSGTATFKDVDVPGHWAASYVQRAVSAGLIRASDYGEYMKPDEVIPREEMAGLLVTASVIYLAAHLEVRYEALAQAPVFTDQDTVQERYRSSVQECARLGLLLGFPDGTFRPNEGLTRAQAATVITRVLGMQSSKDILRATPPAGFKWAGGSFAVLAAAEAFEGNVNLRLTGPGGSRILESYTTAAQGMGWGVLGVYVDGALLAGQSPVSFELYLVSMKDGDEYSQVSLALNLK